MKVSAPTCWRHTVARVLSAVLPGTENVPGVDEVRCTAFLMRYSREAPFLARFALNLSVLAFLFSPPLTGTGLRPALALSEGRLERHCTALANHRSYHLRQATLMLKTVAGLSWGADPSVRTALGLAPYPGDPPDWRTD